MRSVWGCGYLPWAGCVSFLRARFVGGLSLGVNTTANPFLSTYLQAHDLATMPRNSILAVSMWVGDEAESTESAVKVYSNPVLGQPTSFEWLPRSLLVNPARGETKPGERAAFTFEYPVWKIYSSLLTKFVTGPGAAALQVAA